MRKIGIVIVFILISSGQVFPLEKEVIDEIVAIVNDDIITLSQYKQQHDALYQMLKAQLQGEEFEKQYAQMKKELLNTMITNLLLLQEARRRGYDAREQVKLFIDNIKKEYQMDSDDELKRALQRQGMNYEEWIKQREEDFLRQNVIGMDVDRKISIDDSEIVNYHKLHPEEFTEPQEYKLRAIYISSEGKSDEEVEAKKREINERIESGEDLSDLASQYSEGPEKDSQGDLGSFKKGELESSLEQAVEKLKVGEMTPWLEMKNGWYLLKLEEKKESRLKSFEEARKEIEEKLFSQKRQEKIDEFLKELTEKSYIKILKPNPLDL